MVKAVDVSSYQGTIDWAKVKSSGINYAILKIIRKDLSPDTMFERNYKACMDNKINILGVYNYSYATSSEMARRDAEAVVNILNGRKTTVILDIEDNCQKNIGDALIDIINVYSNVITSNGNKFMIYTGQNFYNLYLKKYSSMLTCPFWIAKYSTTKPIINNKLYAWQYTSSGNVSGIVGKVDMNEVYITEEIKMGTIAEKDIKICGHGSGTPSIKTMSTYLTTRYNSKAPNGKRKGVVKVMRFKELTDVNRVKFHDKYKTIIGRNSYNQSLRQYVYTSKNGKYYSDCSSSGMATLQSLGYTVGLLNTAGIYTSKLFQEVPVNIVNGHITNPEVLKVGDCLLFVGTDASRPLQIGHVEYIYEINGGTDITTTPTTSYTKTQFISEVQSAIGATVDGIAGINTLNKTVTVSTKINKKHKVVLPLQKYLNSIGYDCGTPDGDAGNKFDLAVKKWQKEVLCLNSPDGEFTSKGSSWKKILGIV